MASLQLGNLFNTSFLSKEHKLLAQKPNIKFLDLRRFTNLSSKLGNIVFGRLSLQRDSFLHVHKISFPCWPKYRHIQWLSKMGGDWRQIYKRDIITVTVYTSVRREKKESQGYPLLRLFGPSSPWHKLFEEPSLKRC